MPTIFESRNTGTAATPPPKDVGFNHFSKFSHDKTGHYYLHSFCIRPKVRFETQRGDEELILLLRAHPITQIPWILGAVVVFLVPLFLSVIIGHLFTPKQLIFANFFWYSFLVSYIFINILHYIFNVGIVTNFRVIDVDFHNVLYKEVNQTVLPKIEDITAKTGGFIKMLFHYGDVFVQTAGAEANIEFHGVPEPTEVASIINELMKQRSS